MSLRALLPTLLALTVSASSLSADLIVLGDSGWTVETVGTRVDLAVAVLEVDRDLDFIRIEIDKNYGPVIWDGDEADFPVAHMRFTRTSPGVEPVGTIIIDNEDIHNGTGLAWSLFRWDIFEGSAAFDAAASGGWDVTPQFDGWDPYIPGGGGYRTIAASGGPGLADGSDFNPSGGLVIDADGDFTLKQQVLPEPASLVLVAVGALLAVLRKRSAR